MNFSTSVVPAGKSPDVDLLDLQAEFRELVGQSLMTPRPQIERNPPRPQPGHDIERTKSSVARLTSSSMESLEGLIAEFQGVQKFLKTEVTRVQGEIDNAMTGIKIIMETIAPLRGIVQSKNSQAVSG
jgi:hypothetical protein